MKFRNLIKRLRGQLTKDIFQFELYRGGCIITNDKPQVIDFIVIGRSSNYREIPMGKLSFFKEGFCRYYPKQGEVQVEATLTFLQDSIKYIQRQGFQQMYELRKSAKVYHKSYTLYYDESNS